MNWRMFYTTGALVLLLNACGNTTVPQSTSTSAPVPESTAVTSRPAETPPAEPSAVCAAQTPRSATDSQPEANRSDTTAEQNGMQQNTIVVGNGKDVTLAELGRSLNDPARLRELAPGEWLLSANMQVETGGRLRIGGAGVQRLKLKSDATGFVWIKALGGTLEFDSVCVTSWDVQRNRVDEAYADGRSFVLARDGATMNIRRAELSYLGYDANESYGLAWRLNGTNGEITDSTLGYNYYGLYTYQVSGLIIRGNEVHYSVQYGIDPHTKSNRLTIENNVSHHNGKHGIILAEGCTGSTIRNNTVYGNTLHGIVLYQRSNNNTVENNTAYRNGLEGINLNESSNNTITNNTVYENTKAGIGIGQKSNTNTIRNNVTRNNQEDGIALYSEAKGNVVVQNEVRDNERYGVYVKSAGNEIAPDNRVSGNRKGDVQE